MYKNQIDLEACKVFQEVRGRECEHRYLIIVVTRHGATHHFSAPNCSLQMRWVRVFETVARGGYHVDVSEFEGSGHSSSIYGSNGSRNSGEDSSTSQSFGSSERGRRRLDSFAALVREEEEDHSLRSSSLGTGSDVLDPWYDGSDVLGPKGESCLTKRRSFEDAAATQDAEQSNSFRLRDVDPHTESISALGAHMLGRGSVVYYEDMDEFEFGTSSLGRKRHLFLGESKKEEQPSLFLTIHQASLGNDVDHRSVLYRVCVCVCVTIP